MLGNNYSTFQYLKSSIISIFQQSVAGVSMSGADICGFFGNTTADLCAAWYSIGAYYPFSRNHNDIASEEQEPWFFQGEQLGVIRQSMINKLSLIRYYHTEMLKISQEGGSFFKPLFFAFPDDAGAYDNQHLNAMAGRSLKLAFNSAEIKDTTDFYYPKGVWCNIMTTASYSIKCTDASAGSKTVTQPSKLGNTYAELMQGRIIPFQNVTELRAQGKMINNTFDLKFENVDLLVLPSCSDTSCFADGDYYNDNDTSASLNNELNKYQLKFTNDYKTQPGKFLLEVTQLARAQNHENAVINQADALGKIQILNVKNSQIDSTATYKVTVNYQKGKGDPVELGNTVYDKYTDVVSTPTSWGKLPIWLGEIESISFTKN